MLPLTLDEYIEFFTFGGQNYAVPYQQSMPGMPMERIGDDFLGLTQGAYKRNGVVFACMLVRMLVFKEARPIWRARVDGRAGRLFGNADLDVIDNPWTNGSSYDLLARAIQDADLAGNSFIARKLGADALRRLRPDWTTIIYGTDDPAVDDLYADDPRVDLVGYAYEPGGPASSADAIFYRPDEVAHFAPIPDPEARWRGMSWISPLIRELTADNAAVIHKERYLTNAATPNLVVTFENPMQRSDFDKQVTAFRESHEGARNAWKTLFLGYGADVKVVGNNLKDIDFKAVQAFGETHIAAAAGVPAVLVGLSEGLASATYSNFASARRRFADGTMRPLWGDFYKSLETIVPFSGNGAAELWYDDNAIPFIQEDRKDAAVIGAMKAARIASYITSGFEPDSAVACVIADDESLLRHTGMTSVQLMPPGSQNGSQNDSASQNGQAANADVLGVALKYALGDEREEH